MLFEQSLQVCHGLRWKSPAVLSPSCRCWASLLLVLCMACYLTPGAQATHPEAPLQEENSQAGSEDDAAPLTRSQVRPLLRQLEADTIGQRDQAEQALLDLGPKVLGFLPEVTARTSGEMKIRLQRIRQALESNQLETFFEASRLTLQGTMTLSEAMDSIVEQTDNAISLRGEDAFATREVTLDAVDRPFWEVIEALMQQSQLRINSFATTENELVLTPGGTSQDGTLTAFTSGPFRVDVSSIEATRTFNAALDGQLGLSLQVTWEPRLKPVFMQIPMRSLAAQAGDEELTATNPQATPEIQLNYGGCTTQLDLQLTRPSRSQDKLENLQGEFTIAVPADSHRYEFKKFGNGARQAEKFGDVNVVLEGSRRNGPVYEVRLLIEFGDAQGALDSFRGWILSNKAYLLDAKQGRLADVGWQTYAQTPNAYGIAYLFQINGDPNDYTLVYESPASVTRQTVKYQLSNIPLP